jgi:type IV secretory pathway TraG/TraD family ATPase VirD4
MIGLKKTKKVEKKDGKDVETPKEEPLFTEMDIMKIPKDKQLVIFQGWYHRPIEAINIQYYQNKTEVQKRLMAKIAMGESSPLPEFLIPKHHAIMGYNGTPCVLNPNTNEIKILEPLH